MSNPEKKLLLPELRFSEFQDTGNWEVKQLGTCLSRKPEYGINAPAVPYAEDLPVYLRITDISEEGYFIKNKKVSVAKKVNEDNYLSSGDLVLARTGASVGKSYKYKETDGPLVFAGFLIRVSPDIRKLNSEMLFQFLSTEWYWRWVDFSSVRSGQPGINVVEYASLPIPLPPTLDEQEKIADCLSSLDNLIAEQSEKVKALKIHKKGLIQQLFPDDAETMPELRFPKFKDAGEWKKEAFGKIIKVMSGKGFKASEYSKAGNRLLQIENVGYGTTKWNENTNYLPERYSEEYPELVLRDGDIVLALNRPVTNNELKIARIQKEDEPVILYQRVGKLELLDVSLNADFIFQVCQQFVKDFVLKKSIGSDQPFIALRDLYAQNILIPTPEEQQKIADCLFTIDELIAAQTQKAEALKNHKTGLMQQLFPSAENNYMGGTL